MHQTDLPKGDLYKTETLIKYIIPRTLALALLANC